MRSWRRVARLLSAAGVRFWLCDGSALGAVREGRFLPTDRDIDLGVWPADRVRLLAAFTRAGRVMRRVTPTQLQPVAKTKIDIHVHTPLPDDPGRVFYRLGKRGRVAYAFDAALFAELQPIELHGVRTLVPPPDAYLTAHYGPDWRTPRPKWRYDRDPACVVRR